MFNKNFIIALVLIGFSGLCNPTKAHAKNQAEDDSLSIGLVLSGGGARGIAHIGVLKALEEVGIRPDYITGTSMGSIIGGLYAIGYTASELDSLARTQDWNQLFTDEVSHQLLSMQDKIWDGRFFVNLPTSEEKGIQLPKGLIAGQQISLLLTRLFWPVLDVHDFNQFPIPFGCVAMDLETGEAVFLNQGFITDAIRSSISIPTVFTPNLDLRTNQVLVDGGWVRNLPVSDAKRMGADLIIAVDVSTELDTRDEIENLLDVFEQTSKYRINELNEKERELTDILMIPTAKDFNAQDFDKVDTLISSGYHAALEKREELIALRLKSGKTFESPLMRKKKIRPLYISKVTYSGLEKQDPAIFNRVFEDLKGSLVYPEDISFAVQNLYAKGNFASIKQLIYPDQDSKINGYQVHFQVEEQAESALRVGIRFDSETQASLLFQAAGTDILSPRSNLLATIRLGEDKMYQLQHTQLNAREWLGYQLLVEYRSRRFQTFERSRRVADYGLNQFSAHLMGGSIVSNRFLFTLGMRFDIYNMVNPLNVVSLGLPDSQELFSFQSILHYDNWDRVWFPTRGNKWLIQFNASNPLLGEKNHFSHLRLYQSMRTTPNPWITLGTDIYMVRTTGDQLPPMFYAFAPIELTGIVMDYVFFYGKERQQLSGRNLALASGTLQVNFTRQTNLSLHYSLGNHFKRFDSSIWEQELSTGFALSYGTQTLIGPVQLLLGGNDETGLTWNVRVGYQF